MIKALLLSTRSRVVTPVVAAMMCCGVVVAEPVEASSTIDPKHFATVGDQFISMQEFEAAYEAGIKKRFYHGKVPEEQLKAFRKEVSQTLVDRLLQLQEAKRQGIVADQDEVNKQLALYERRYEKQAHWKQYRDQIITGLTAALEEENILEKFEQKVKNVPEPKEAEVRRFYEVNSELFTTPERLHLSVILLKVAPSSPSEVWEAARIEAQQIVEKLANGANFGSLARIHSGDATAAAGGDMGFVHQGMLAAPAQMVIDQLKDGEVSTPVMLLSGVAVFRLEERQAARLNDFEVVAKRAKELLIREQKGSAWSNLTEQLRSSANVTINSAAL